MPHNNGFSMMHFTTVAEVNDPTQLAWEAYMKANKSAEQTAPGTPERTAAERVRNAYANAFVNHSVFYDPKEDVAYEGSQAKDARIFRAREDGSPKVLYVGALGANLKDIAFFPMTINSDGTMTLSDNLLKYDSYRYGLSNYIFSKNPTLPGDQLKEYVEHNYNAAPTLATITNTEQDEEALAKKTDPNSPLRTMWNKFKDADKLYSDPNSEYAKNHSPEEVSAIRKEYDAQRQKAFMDFLAYAEFIEPSTGRVIPKNEKVWTNPDLIASEGESFRDFGGAGYRQDKGYLLVRDPGSDPSDGQVFVFKREGSTYTLADEPLFFAKYPVGYAKYLKVQAEKNIGLNSRSLLSEIYSPIHDNTSLADLQFLSSQSSEPEGGLTDEMLEAAGEFFNGIGSLENNPTFIENGAPVFINRIEEAEPVYVNRIIVERPLVKNFIYESKPVINNYIIDGGKVTSQMTEFMGHELDFSPIIPAKATSLTYAALEKNLADVDKSMFPSKQFADMVKAFKDVKDAGQEYPNVKEVLYSDLVDKATEYLQYKAPGGKLSDLSDYERSRVEFAEALMEFGNSKLTKSMEEAHEFRDGAIISDFYKECCHRARTTEASDAKSELEANVSFFAAGVFTMWKLSSKYPEDSKMHALCQQMLSDRKVQSFQHKIMSAAGIDGPVTPENFSKIERLESFADRLGEISARAAKAESLRGANAEAKVMAANTYSAVYDRLNKKLDAANQLRFGSDKFEKMVTAFKALKDVNKSRNSIEMQIGFSNLVDAANAYLDYKLPADRDLKLSENAQARVDIAELLVEFGQSGVNAAQKSAQNAPSAHQPANVLPN